MSTYLDPLSSKAVFIDNAGINLEVHDFGETSDKLVILLHGFPECWGAWRHQIAPLVTAGYRVLVPNLRGYGKGDKPAKIIDYRIDKLATDIDALLMFAQHDKCHLVGHDWGGAVAWWYGIHCSDKLHSLSILNAPHPLAFLEVLKKSPHQWLKSWYIFFFQLPWLPEALMSRLNFKRLRDTLTKTSNKGAYDQRDIALLTQTWSQPGCIRAMLNYYRCLLRDIKQPLHPAKVECPSQLLWGEQDLALTLPMAELSTNYLANGKLKRFPDASHWLNHDKPQAVTAELLQFFEQSQLC